MGPIRGPEQLLSTGLGWGNVCMFVYVVHVLQVLLCIGDDFKMREFVCSVQNKWTLILWVTVRGLVHKVFLMFA